MNVNSFPRLLLGIVLMVFGIVCFLSYRAHSLCTIVTDYPSHNADVLALKCQGILDKDETGDFTATLRNTQAVSSSYRVLVNQVSWPTPFNASISGDPTDSTFALAPGESTQFLWNVKPETIGSKCFTVTAFSQFDLALPGTFHTWFRSALATCSFEVIDLPGLTGRQFILLKNLLGAMALLGGIVIIGAWIARRKTDLTEWSVV